MRGTTACHRRDAHITGRPASRNWRCVRVCLFSSHSIYTSHLHEVGKLFPVMIYLRKQKPESQSCISSTRNSIFLRERDEFAPPAVFVVIALHCVCARSPMCVRVAINQPYKYISSVNDDPPHFHFGIFCVSTFGDAELHCSIASLRTGNYSDIFSFPNEIRRKIVDDTMETRKSPLSPLSVRQRHGECNKKRATKPKTFV